MELYDAGVRWVDTQVARLIEALQRYGHWDKCIFAFTADHGEEFLDHGGRYHSPTRPMEELIHVPLLICVPGVAGKKLSNSPFSLLHLAPTLLEGAGLTSPPEFHGTSFWGRIKAGETWESAAIVESVTRCSNPFRREHRLGPRALAVREARYKLVLYFDPQEEWLYDLDTDPGEQAPLPASAEVAVRRRMLERAREHLVRQEQRRDPTLRFRALLRELRLEWIKSTSLAHPVSL
jgi:arylsulfatase A-like enzyme